MCFQSRCRLSASARTTFRSWSSTSSRDLLRRWRSVLVKSIVARCNSVRRTLGQGNIRELQNIVERSVILCSGETFSIDEAWLSIQDESARSAAPARMTRIIQDQEKEIIESALAQSAGKVAGAG